MITNSLTYIQINFAFYKIRTEPGLGVKGAEV